MAGNPPAGVATHTISHHVERDWTEASARITDAAHRQHRVLVRLMFARYTGVPSNAHTRAGWLDDALAGYIHAFVFSSGPGWRDWPGLRFRSCGRKPLRF